MSVSAMLNFYKQASICLYQIDKSHRSVSSVALKPELLFKKRLFALLSEVIKKKHIIESIIKESGIHHTNEYELMVLLHDYLYIKDKRYQEKLFELFPIISDNAGTIEREWKKLQTELIIDNRDKMNTKYLRLNLLAGSEQEILSQLDNDISKYIPHSKTPYYVKDQHLPNLLMLCDHSIFIEFHKLSTIQRGLVFVQDKASCIPAHVLNPSLDSTVIDACAAPGNKTTHLAMILRNTGRILAIEKDKLRFHTLNLMIQRSNASNIHTFLHDFLSISPNTSPFCDAEYILLDPSCSGSHSDISKDSSRIKSLSNFQKHALIHSTRFPKVKKIVYSTCSITEEENEQVVAHVLKHQSIFKLSNISNDIIREWKHRGNSGIIPNGQESHVLRADLENDNCHAFFVALFERCDNKAKV